MKFLLIFSFLLFSVPSFAFKEVPPLEQELFLMKVQSTVIQNNEWIRQAVTEDLAEEFLSKPELITDEDPSKLIEILEREYQKQLSTSSKIKLIDEFKDHIQELAAEARSIVRTQGIGLGVMFISMEIGQFIVAGAVASAGHPEVAAAIGAIHYNEFILMGKGTFSKLLKIRKTIQAYGGKEQYRFFKKLHKRVNRSLHLRGKDGMVIAVSKNESGEFDALSLSKMGFLNRLFSRIYPNREKLDLVTLKHFLKKQGLRHQLEIHQILDDSAEDWAKIAMIVNHLRREAPEAFEELKVRFPQSLIEIEPFQLSESLKQWSLMGLSAENREDILYFSSHVPAGLRVLDVIKVWSKCLFPIVLEEPSHQGYFNYRHMVKRLSGLEIAAEVNFDEMWSSDWAVRFAQYFQ